MKTKLTPHLLATLLSVAFTTTLHAQLVADGDILVLNTATNLAGDLIVGTNGGNTRLAINSPGTVTNVNGRIGLNATSTGNQVQVRNSGAVWNNTGYLFVGDQGADNSLLVTNGGNVLASYIRIGNDITAVGNQAIVTGTNSLLTASTRVSAGYDGPSNSLVIADGASVVDDLGYIGDNSPYSSNNWVTVTGPNSLWENSSDLHVGFYGSGNRLVVSNHAVVAAADWGVVGYGSSDNVAVVTGVGSLWTNGNELTVGWYGRNNQLIVSNGATVVSTYGYLGANWGANDNQIIVTGMNSVWTNSGEIRIGSDDNTVNNQLSIQEGGVVYSGNGYLGSEYYSGANSNRVLVSGIDSRWNSSGSLYVGELGSGNQLRLQAGGSVIAAGSTHVGSGGGSNNLLHVDVGILTVAANLDVRRGTLRLDSGQITAANLIATNGSEGKIIFNGGLFPPLYPSTLSVSNSAVNNGSPLVVGNGSPAVYRLLGTGLHSFNDGLVISDGAFLRGSGTIDGLLTVSAGGEIDFSTFGGLLQSLTLSNSPSLAGTIRMRLRVAGGLTNDLISVPTVALAYGGTLEVTRLGGAAPVNGNTFKLFNAASYGGAFTSISLPPLDPSLMWTNRLLEDGSIAVVNWTGPKLSGVGKSGTNLTFNVTDGVPGGAYELLTSPNVATPLTNWVVLDSGNFDWLGKKNLSIPINPAIPQRFYTVRVP
jgi:T5SS/PEP-CTERM-associated repeat protein